jgi:alpha-L-fucosidase 2
LYIVTLSRPILLARGNLCLRETVEGLYNLFQTMMAGGRRTAREMYGTEGLVAHHNTDGWGDTEPIDGVSSGMWPFGAAWLSLALWDHYDFSRDEHYLREKAYPILRESALYLLNNLFPDGLGHLVSGPSLFSEEPLLYGRSSEGIARRFADNGHRAD